MTTKNAKNAKSPLKKSAKSHKTLVENSSKKSPKTHKKVKNTGSGKTGSHFKNKKVDKILATFGVIGLVGGAAGVAAGFLLPQDMKFTVKFPEANNSDSKNNIYSRLTGLPLASEAEVTAPAYCVQMPNGLDGARPQAGLDEAGVVFEAIAEAGITRFAAIYQNPTAAVIGPIRSLRTYYLEWDTPFDCTIVHAGGSGDALAAVARGYKDLTEDYSYMYRGTAGARAWNNLFTTSAYLKKMSADRGYDTSDIKGFTRMTPEESLVSRVDSLVEEKLVIYEPSQGKTSTLTGKVIAFGVNFGGLADFNLRYNYNADTNTYARSYATGYSHDIYTCPMEDLGEKNPEGTCKIAQASPAVVAVIKVAERRASDNYHENITTVGSGEAYVFQNGTVIEGTWKKASVAEQIKFYDASGTEIALAPGQTFVEAIPTYGSVEY